MSIKKKLEQLREKDEKALAIFATAGDPDRSGSIDVFRIAAEAGADILEIGIPYSDPLMDGPVLQQSYQRSLGEGFKLKNFPAYIETIRNVTGTPTLIMTCYNPVYRYGVMRFFRDVSSAGADAVLLTDLPPEEWGESMAMAEQFGLGTIFLVAPTTPDDRLERIGKLSDPFLYCISKIGITGSEGQAGLPETLKEYVAKVKSAAARPVLVGFGISTPRDAALAGGLADGIVVGSALVKIIERNGGNMKTTLPEAEKFVSGLKKALLQKS